MLNRFLASKMASLEGGGAGGGPGGARRRTRPRLASDCRDLNEADKWRGELLREIGKKVMDVQNAALGEHRLRDLNDEINKLIREKAHWEARIVQLGGPNHARAGPRAAEGGGPDPHAVTAPGKHGGYRYFGAAKSLPGVRELFEKPAARVVRRTRAQLTATIDADYYGFGDEEDGVLLRVEAEAEAALRAAAAGAHAAEAARRAADGAPGLPPLPGGGGGEGGGGGGAPFTAHVPLPDRADIEALVVSGKKRALLARYASPELIASEAATGEALGVKRARGGGGGGA